MLALRHRSVRFVLSGALSSVVEYVSFVVLSLLLPWPVVVVQPVSFLCGVASSYSLNRFWVFRSSSSYVKSLSQFMLLACFNALASTFLMYVVTEFGGIDKFVAKVAIMAIIAIWNYVVFSKLIFRSNSKDSRAGQ